MDRLTGMNYFDPYMTPLPPSTQWSYDRYGNRWTQSGAGAQPALQFDVTTNHISGTGYTYDAAGNMTADGSGNTYTYDADGNLIASSGPGFSTTASTYNALNQRVKYQTGTQSELYTFNPFGQRSASYDGSENLVRNQIYWGSTPVAFLKNGVLVNQFQDRLGTEAIESRLWVSGTWLHMGAFGDNFTSSPTPTEDPLHFAGLDADSDSTSHAQFRNYVPNLGRWSTPDQYVGSYDAGNPQSLNRYAYVLNNPLSATDPTGLWGFCVSTSYNEYVGSWWDDQGVLYSSAVDIPNNDGYCEEFGDVYGAGFGRATAYWDGSNYFGGTAPNNGNPANPCSTANPNNLDYTSANAQQHIMQNHMPGGKGPGIYVGDWTAIKLLNQATLTMGAQDPSQLLRDTGSGTYTLQWTAPPMIWPLSLIFTNNIGWSSPGNPTPTNRLVVTTNCSKVVTSYPIP